MYKLLKALTPLVLVLFISAAMAAPALSSETNEYHVISPTQVSRGDTFELTVDSSKGVLNQKDVSLQLPPGFKYVQYLPVYSPDGSLKYKIQASLTDGTYVIYVQINSATTPMTLSQKITVQQSDFERAQPFLIGAGILAVLFLINGGMAK
jgi:hypothetical protein